MINNITGGVSPLKKGEEGAGSGKSIARKRHAGTVGKEATATKAQDKSGYSRSGADYINVHSFTPNTRFTSSLASSLAKSSSGLNKALTGLYDKGSSSVKDAIEKGYDYENDPDKIIKQVRHIGSWDYKENEKGEPTNMPTREQAWELNLDDINAKYKSFEDYEKDMTDPNKKPVKGYKRPEYKEDGHYVETEETVEGEHRRRPYKIVNGKKIYTGKWEVYTPKSKIKNK